MAVRRRISRTLMLWQLAERRYNVNGLYSKLYGAKGDTMRAKSVELIALLQSGDKGKLPEALKKYVK